MRSTILLILLSVFSLVEAATIRAPMHSSQWESNARKTLCRLTHQIDDQRQAGFISESGEPLQFFLKEGEHAVRVDSATLFVEPAPWQHILTYQQDYPVFWQQGSWQSGYLAVYGRSAEDMLSGLSNGHEPVFSLVRHSVESRVAVSSIKFTESYQQFLSCRQALFPFGKRQLQQGDLFFYPRQSSLSEPIQNRLQLVAAYMKEMKQEKLSIVDKTQAGKKANHWFKKRSSQIVNQLIKLGIDKNRVKVIDGNAAKNVGAITLNVFGPDNLLSYYYRKGNTKLNRQEEQKLAQLAEYINEFHQQGRVVISSHTDSKGSRAANLKVSKNRGKTIKDFLQSKGVKSEKIVVKAYGETRPVKSNRFPSGRAMNRRAIIRLVN